MTPPEAASKAAKLIGSQAALARLLRVRPPTVSQWCNGERPIPAPRAVQIETFTNGEVSRVELCPSFPWAVVAN
ncbi:transcriptional regulator [Pseudomonas sp. NY15437]|uniref:transcriptional regulator n=1 Tax=Pseudomonas sp. NY15437 TaxID=3400360 RepID=UPI003A8B5B0E